MTPEKVVIGVGGKAETYHLMVEGQWLCGAEMHNPVVVDRDVATGAAGRFLCGRCRWIDRPLDD